jgi:uncharacterized repeat protein (TIGR03803 family)
MKHVLVVLALLTGAIAQTSVPTINALFSFPCDSNFVCPDGWFPSSLIESPDGNFYGAASEGGVGKNAQGTVFKMTPNGQISVIYSFAELPDGSLPFGASPTSLVEGMDGFLYGTTLVDGKFGAGTVFKLSKAGVIQDLHDFCATLTGADGCLPAFITQGLDGNFYGVTGPTNVPQNVIFRISPSGSYKVLHTFDTKQQPDGAGAYSLTPTTDGNFHGATVAGQQNKPFNSVFRFNPTTGAYTILHGFNWPNVATADLIQASNGELFGVESNSRLYHISTSGQYHLIGPLSPTQFWNAEILQASDGNLWGDFQSGCGFQGGVFAATTTGSIVQNLVFNCNTDGQQPNSMLQAADGRFYGLTMGGGGISTTNPVENGTFWVMDAALPKPSPSIVNLQPTSGKAGSTVLLQGSHLVGTTAVTFNGVNAAFQVLTANYIRAIVPGGASSGKIAVTNAGGTTKSPKAFTVQ